MRLASYTDFHREDEGQSIIEKLCQTFSSLFESAVTTFRPAAPEDRD